MLNSRKVSYMIIAIVLFICTGCTDNTKSSMNQKVDEANKNVEKSINNVTVKEEVYLDVDDSINKDIELKYPVIDGLDEEETQKQINNELKEASLNVLNDFSSLEDMNISTSYEVMLNNNKILSILYTASSMHTVQAYPLIRTHAINIDMLTGNKLSGSDIIVIDDDFISVFREKFELVSEYESDEDKERVKEYVYDNISLEMLREASIGFYPETSYFLTENALNISIAVPFSLGSYAVFSTDYSDINENISLGD